MIQWYGEWGAGHFIKSYTATIILVENMGKMKLRENVEFEYKFAKN